MYDNNQRYGGQQQHTAPPYAQPAPTGYNYGYGPPPAQPLGYPPQQQAHGYVTLSLCVLIWVGWRTPSWNANNVSVCGADTMASRQMRVSRA